MIDILPVYTVGRLDLKQSHDVSHSRTLITCLERSIVFQVLEGRLIPRAL
jgi:hypothetical protein